MAGEIFPGILPDDGDRAHFDGLADTDDGQFADGCPWCDAYDGESVPQHASSAHPDEWAAHKAQLDNG